MSYADSASDIDFYKGIDEWRVLKTLHFNLYYTEQSVNVAVLCSKFAEENYIYISNYLNYELDNVVNIVIPDQKKPEYLESLLKYKKKDEFCRYTDSYGNYLFLSFNGNYFDLRRALTHKLTHVFQYEILFNESPWNYFSYNSLSDFPVLLTEAMSDYIAAGYHEYEDIVINDLINSTSYPEIMDIRQYDSLSKDLIPELGKSFYYFIEKNYGTQKISEILWNSINLDLTEAIEKALSSDVDKINSEWIIYYKKRYSEFWTGDTDTINKTIALPGINNKTNFNFSLSAIDENNIYYLGIRDNIYEVYKSDLTRRKSTVIFKYISGINVTRLQDVISFFNNPSISVKSGKAVYVKNHEKRVILVFVNIITRKIVEEITFPFNKIADVSLSADGNKIIFTGISNISSDIFIYDINKKSLTQITDDFFSERYPKISADNSFIVYCSNINRNNDPEADEYKLIKYDLDTQKRTEIISQKNILHPEISSDSKKVIYSSNITGLYNAYYYDIKTRENIQLTDSPRGALFPCWFPDGKRILYSSYIDDRLVINSADIDDINISQEKNHDIPEYKKITYPVSYFDIKDTVLSDYKYTNNSIINSIVSGQSIDNNYLLSAGFQLTNYLNSYKLTAGTDINRIEKENSINVNIEYDYLKYRFDFGLGFFYRSDPLYTLNFFYPDYLSSHLRAFYRNSDTEEFGTYISIDFPLYKNIYFLLKTGYARNNDKGLLFNSTGDDRYTNNISASFGYDSLVIEKVHPVSGMKLEAGYDNSFNITGNDFQYSTITLHFIKAQNFFNRLFFTVNAELGKILGKDKNHFVYNIGGHTIRGHDLIRYRGNNAFLFRSEIRLLLLKRAILSNSVPMKFKNISLVLFFDAGSAWDGDYDLRGNDGEFNDFKAGTGAGFRFLVFDHLFFKLDAAWPYFYKSFGSNQITAAFEFRY